MEVVRVFNNELSSLYDVKPPISKAKMTQITKSAIKGIKLYKHIVQSVEKFIQKCRPEYKVPGLYVVDSIVRQSRHQFGADKDVFGPRFVKNISSTFQNLFKCSEDDRPKIIRVLNLWQKNNVFPIDVIQPLLDMGHPNSAGESLTTLEDAQNSRHKPNDSSWKGWPQSNEEPVSENRTYAEITTTNLEKFTKAEMINSMEDEISRSSVNKNLTKPVEETVKFNKELLAFDYGDEEDEEEAKNDDSHMSNQTNALAFSMAQNFLNNPDLLKQIQQMQKTIQQNEALKALNSDMTLQTQIKTDDNDVTFPSEIHNSPQQHLLPSATTYQQPILPHNLQLSQSEADKDDRVIPEPQMPPRDLDERSLASVMASHDRLLPTMCLAAFQHTGLSMNLPVAHSEADKDDRKIPEPAMPPRDLDERSLASIIAPLDRIVPGMQYADGTNVLYPYDKNQMPFPPPQPGMSMLDSLSMERSFSHGVPPEQHLLPGSGIDEDDRMMYSLPGEPPLPPQDFDERSLMMPSEERGRKEKSRSPSGSRSRGRGKHRSRSRSPRRKRSRSRSRSRKRSRSRERERIREKERERERERERRRKGLPPIKKGCVSVCSTTIWLGHVPKSCSELDISSLFSQYGNILSIDMIPPRGCAYVVMERRQDGYRALQKLKNVKLQSSSIKMAWAPGKGVKGKEYKDYWEMDLGVSYVPFEKISDDTEALDLLEEGGFIDEDSLPDHLKALKKSPNEEKQSLNPNKVNNEVSKSFNELTTTPNMVPPPVIPPTSVGLPMVVPHLMQPQFGLHLPGLLPPQAMVMQVPMGIPPPNPMLMVQSQAQNILNNQSLQIVGGVPQMVSRSVPPPVTSTLPSLKNIPRSEHILGSPMVGTTGDATPTEEDGTSVSSPNVPPIPTSSAVTTSLSIASTHPGSTLSQFNATLGIHNATRSIMAVPPPVSTAVASIPYPPPNVNFNIPPPGVRPPAQSHIMSNSQFAWMPKLSTSFSDAESGQSNSSMQRSIAPPQSGTHMHMFGNRSTFHESSPNQPSSLKDRSERNSGSTEVLCNRSISPRHDKSVEMVISTDDESSMDQEYPRVDIPPGGPGPRFPMTEFPRLPMNMPRMRGPPPGPMPGPRFSRGMHLGSPYPMRMGSPRGMGVHGMHPRMEMEFAMHPGSRGPRMPSSPHTPRRNEMHTHEGRNWYPRDSPPFERDRDRHFHNDWNRESWMAPEDIDGGSVHLSRTNDGNRHDDHHNDQWNHDGRLNSASEIGKGNEKKETDVSFADKNEKLMAEKSISDKNDHKMTEKPKLSKSLKHDMFKLQFYQRDQKPRIELLNKKLEESMLEKFKPENDSAKTEYSNLIPELISEEKKISNDSTQFKQSPGTTKRDRDARKRSRWGRTLSEEREFQEQKRFEIEIKFQSYEQFHAAQQPPVDANSEAASLIPIENASDVELQNEAVSLIPIENASDVELQNAPADRNCDIVSTLLSQDDVIATDAQGSDVISNLQNNSTLLHTLKDDKSVNSSQSLLLDNISIVNCSITSSLQDNMVSTSSTILPTPSITDGAAIINSTNTSASKDNTIVSIVTPMVKDDVAMFNNESDVITPMVKDVAMDNNECVSNIGMLKDDVHSVNNESISDTSVSKDVTVVDVESISNAPSLKDVAIVHLENIASSIQSDNLNAPLILNDAINLDNMKPVVPKHLTESSTCEESSSDLFSNTQGGARTLSDNKETTENSNVSNSPVLSAES